MLNDATKFSGALRERVSDAAGLTPMAERVGHFLFVQYIVTYLWPNPMLSTLQHRDPARPRRGAGSGVGEVGRAD